eukprot:CAMPEP_0202445182 /NCGR_PEP_ID=MMETSP1360-20130828/4058_1 /ASSEMBLY_ACC=CAM_ASM_000848 /TAXON_ID=515479 /ORGANISM="Licmophora paradoxa, Strain CCMP2313" /LENGTH=149 /DNA_ID=CAMNT_0049061365 /DNA_START=205 /DNA_END=654 /DNA_ORIENTATION=-
MITQPDSFQAMSYAKVMSVPIPIYHMKQPNRISTLELEFQLALVKDLTMAGKSLVYESPVPMERAIDSWFTGYYWTPILMSCGAAGVDAEGTSGGYQHVGWKFTSLDEQESTLPFFYALMIKRDDKKKSNGVHIGGFRAPGWMAHAIVT